MGYVARWLSCNITTFVETIFTSSTTTGTTISQTAQTTSEGMTTARLCDSVRVMDDLSIIPESSIEVNGCSQLIKVTCNV